MKSRFCWRGHHQWRLGHDVFSPPGWSVETVRDSLYQCQEDTEDPLKIAWKIDPPSKGSSKSV